MGDADRSYFEFRAEAEIAAAQQCSDPAASRAHYKLAGYYLDRVYGPGLASDSDYGPT